MSTEHNTKNETTVPSEESQPPMLELAPLLAAQIDNLESTADKLNTANVALLYVAGAVAVVIAVIAFWSNRVNARLRNAQNEVIRAKDEQLKRDLKDKDLQIEQVRAGAQLDVENARNEAKQRIETETKRVEGEAGKKIEAARAEATVKIEAARAEAAKEVGKVQTDLETQRERAAKAEHALLELQERLRWRELTQEQRATLLGLLRADPKGSISIDVPVNDPEAESFARMLAGVLAEAGWAVEGPEPLFSSLPIPRGLTIVVRDAGNAPERAVALQRALTALGLNPNGAAMQRVPVDGVELLVGSKP